MNLNIDSDKDLYELLKELETKADWRIKKSAIVRKVINDYSQKLVFIDLDIAQYTSLSLTSIDPKASSDNASKLNDAKNTKKDIERVLGACESILAQYEKEEKAVG